MLNQTNYPSKAKDVILHFLQTIFAQSSLYEGKNEYLFTRDSKTSKINISDNGIENLLITEQKPSIIVTRGNMQWGGGSLDAFLNKQITGSNQYQDTITVDMTLNCFSREGLEAEFLASLVFQMLTIFKQTIRSDYALHRLDILGLGSESIIQSDSKIDLVVVPVFVKLIWSEKWNFNDQFLRLNKLNINSNIIPTKKESPDLYMEIPINSIYVSPASLLINNAGNNANLKIGLTFSIVNSSKGHDGSYRIGKIKGNLITLLSPLKGSEDEITTSAYIKFIDQGGILVDDEPFTQEVSKTDLTPSILTPNSTG